MNPTYYAVLLALVLGVGCASAPQRPTRGPLAAPFHPQWTEVEKDLRSQWDAYTDRPLWWKFTGRFPENKEAERQYQRADENFRNLHKGSRAGALQVKRLKEVVELLHKAAEQNHAEAMNLLSDFYEEGVVVKKDLKEAAKLRHKAAEQNLSSAQYWLGRDYFDGIDKNFPFKKDVTRAYAWWTLNWVTCAGRDASSSKKALREAVKDMTPEQIAKGDALARELFKKIVVNLMAKQKVRVD